MPELPEAETIVRGLRASIVGERIRTAEVPRPDLLREAKGKFVGGVRGRTVRRVDRRAKNVLIGLDNGHTIAVNLGMTGRLLPFPTAPRGTERPTHPGVVFRFDSGGVLVFDDVRRFGTVECLSSEAWRGRETRFGPEPLSSGFSGSDLHAGLHGSRSPVRSWLLDQRRIAGVGNIYAAEALFLAGIHPKRPANSVSRPEAAALHRALRRVLRNAIRAGGTTIRNYRNSANRPGAYQPKLYVYGRQGQPCLRCGHEIERTVFANRSAFHCPSCQPARAS